MDPIRIVHIEDSKSQREGLAEMFRPGFEAGNVQFESRADCKLLKEELDGQRELAQVYILDNEIGNDTGGYDYGGELASMIYDKARADGQNVLVISLLCSSQEIVEQRYGNELRARDIPVLDKLTQAPLCGFYIARCINKGPISFGEYIAGQSIDLEPQGSNSSDIRDIQAAFDTVVSRNPGSFYLEPSTFVERFKPRMEKFLNPGQVDILDRMYPSPTTGKENPNR